jgi:hypothetical protein
MPPTEAAIAEGRNDCWRSTVTAANGFAVLNECIAVVNVDWHGYANALNNVPASSILTRD